MGAGTDGLNAFEKVAGCGTHGLRSVGVEVVQVNVGLRCNQRCSHCHVEASPERTETMDWPTMEGVKRAAALVKVLVPLVTPSVPAATNW